MSSLHKLYILKPPTIYLQRLLSAPSRPTRINKRYSIAKRTTKGVDPHHMNADLDPSFHFNADLDPNFHFNADPDPDPAPHQINANMRPLVYRLS
jgi:hypothetical protein